MSDYKVKAWSWCADYCKKNQWNPHDSYFWDKAMLQYRRANNIFESDDKIVVKNDCLIDFADLTLNLKVITVLMITDEGFIRSIEAVGLFKSSLVRHATDAEIKAGKRL